MKFPRHSIRCGLVIAALFGVYVAAYCAVLALPASVRLGPPHPIAAKLVVINGELLPDFHGLPAPLFAPLHALDAQFIRPNHWRLSPRNAEMDFAWLLPSTPAHSK